MEQNQEVVLFRWGEDLLQGEPFVQHACPSCSCSWTDGEDVSVRLEGTYYDIQNNDIIRDEKDSCLINKNHESMKINDQIYLCCPLSPTSDFQPGAFFDYPQGGNRRAVVLATDSKQGVFVRVIGGDDKWISWENAKQELLPLGSKIPRASYERALIFEKSIQHH